MIIEYNTPDIIFQLAKSVLRPLGLTEAASAKGAATRKKKFWIWCYSINNFE